MSTQRPHAKRSFLSLEAFDDGLREGSGISNTATVPPPPKRRLTEALASAAATLRQDMPPPTSVPMRAARGIYDHVPIQRQAPRAHSTVEYAEIMASGPAAPLPVGTRDPRILDDDDIDAMDEFDRQAYPRFDGRPITEDVPDKDFPRGLSRKSVEEALLHWKDPDHRREFLATLQTVPELARHTLLKSLRGSFEKNEREFSPAWVEERFAELNEQRTNPKFLFASQVATSLGMETPERMLLSSQDGINRQIRASLEERRAALQNVTNLRDTRKAALDETTNLLNETARLARQLFEKTMPSADINMARLNSILRSQDTLLRETSRNGQAALGLDTTPQNIARINFAFEHGKDQYMLAQLKTLADHVRGQFPQVQGDIIEIQRERTRFYANIDGVESSIDNPIVDLRGNEDIRKRDAFTMLHTLLEPRLHEMLASALQLLARGATAATNTALSSKVTTLLDRDIQIQANNLFEQTRHNSTGNTARITPAPIIIPAGNVTLTYWLLRPFIPGLYTNESSPTAWGQILRAPENTVPAYAVNKQQLNQMYATFGPKRAATWNQIQLAMRGADGAGLEDSDNFIYHLHQNLLLLLDKPATDLGGVLVGSVKQRPILSQAGLDTIVDIIGLLTTGASLELLTKRILKLFPPDQTPTIWHPRLFRGVTQITPTAAFLEQFVDAWEPSLLLDVRFAALAVVVRYQLVRTFLGDLDLAVREYLTQQQRRLRASVEEARQQLDTLIIKQNNSATTGESVAWKFLPEHTSLGVIFSTQLNDAIAQAANFVVDTNYFPGIKIQTTKWISPKPEWGDDAQSFSVLFAEIAAFFIKLPGVSQLGIYVEQRKYVTMDNAREVLIKRLLRYKYVLTPDGTEGYFCRKRQRC